MRPTWVEVDLDAIRHNVALVAGVVGSAGVCAVVKANGYGHGDVMVAESAIAGGANRLAVATVEEGVRLREAGVEIPVLLLSEPAPIDADVLVEWRLTPTVYSDRLLDALPDAVVRSASPPHPVHLKVDTGMHRVGATDTEALRLARRIATDPRIDLEGLWTHLAVAEEDDDFTAAQIGRFSTTVSALGEEGLAPPILHVANTAGTLARDDACFDMVRLGLGMYGMRPAPHVARDLDLRPAMRIVSHITHIRRYPAETRPSYGRRRPLRADATVVTVPIGYADGVARRLSSTGGEVLIGGKRHPLAGTVTMDQIVVDVGEAPVEMGDEVVLLGAQGAERIDADEWAARLGTINYEIVCGIGARVPRRYRKALA